MAHTLIEHQQILICLEEAVTCSAGYKEQHGTTDSPRVNLLKISLCNAAPSTVQEQEKPKG